jgi:hypothetical protein
VSQEHGQSWREDGRCETWSTKAGSGKRGARGVRYGELTKGPREVVRQAGERVKSGTELAYAAGSSKLQ